MRVSVCVSAHARPIFTSLLCVTNGRGSVLLWRRCDTLCTSGFMDDVTIGHNGPRAGVSIPLQRVTSLRRRVQANAAAASYRLRRVLGACGRRD